MNFGIDYVSLYDKFYETKKYKEELNNLQIALSSFGRTLSGKDILEIGCGSGNFTYQLDSVGSVTAVDISRAMINLAKRKFPNTASKFHCMSIESTLKAYNKDTFDVVVLLFHVFSYLSIEEVASLRELTKKLLRPEGLLIFDYWDLDAVDKNRPSDTEKRIEFEGQHYLRTAKTGSKFRSDNMEQFEVNFDFFLERYDKKKFLFAERHTLYSHVSSELESEFSHLECWGNWDIIEGEKFQGKNYGNTKIFIK